MVSPQRSLAYEGRHHAISLLDAGFMIGPADILRWFGDAGSKTPLVTGWS